MIVARRATDPNRNPAAILGSPGPLLLGRETNRTAAIHGRARFISDSGKRMARLPSTHFEGARENNAEQRRHRHPARCDTAVDGEPSGSGKSSPRYGIFVSGARNVACTVRKSNQGRHDEIGGLRYINQKSSGSTKSPGNSPSSNPATTPGVFGSDSRVSSRVLPAARGTPLFTTHVQVQRRRRTLRDCAEGTGSVKIEMHFPARRLDSL